LTKNQVTRLIEKAFPTVPWSENKHINVKGNKSPFDGNLVYWSKRESILYSGYTAKALKRKQNTCGECGLRFYNDERINLHHLDGNHNNWKQNNLIAVHESCHDYLHMSKAEKPRLSGSGCTETRTSRANGEGRDIIASLDSN
jgi:RNA-directed DNA polymerase